MTFAIELIDVSKSYGSIKALQSLTLRVPKGCVFGFLGPNGAGKTTTLRILAGLIRPTQGDVRILGAHVEHDYLEYRRLFTYIPDEGHIYPKMTAKEFLAFIWAIHFREAPNPSRIEQHLEAVGLKDWGSTLIEQYSHGMRQRLLFAAALMRDTHVWMIDEPVIGLDPRAVRMIKDLLRDKAKHGTTIFMSTHILSLAEEICDVIGIIHCGRLVAEGEPASFREGTLEGLEEVFLALTQTEGRNAPFKSTNTNSSLLSKA